MKETAGVMLIVHHLNNSRSQRILWALEELAVPYEIVRYERDPKTMLAPESLTRVHPLGKSPVITDEGHTLAESAAIVEYLVDRYGGRDGVPTLLPAAGDGPAALEDRLQYRFWLHFSEGSLQPFLVLRLLTTQIGKAPVPFFLKPVTKGVAERLESGYVRPNLKKHLDFVEAHLRGKTWFVGEQLTGADILMSFPLENARARGGIDRATHPNIFAFVDRIHARPAYAHALERGGTYDYA